MEKTLSLFVLGDKPGRLDTFVSTKAKISRTLVQKLIEDKCIILNENSAPRPGARLKEGDVIHIRIPVVREMTVEKQEIPLNILFEDDQILVVNKARGMVVHPAPGNPDSTLVNAVAHHVEETEFECDDLRPGIVHRLDKNTSGVMVIAKTSEACQKLVDQFKNRKIHKEYIALLHGRVKGREGVINLPIGRDPKDRKKQAVVNDGKKAVTRWKQRRMFKNYTLVSAFPETGRTHQIRVHFAYLGHPVVGDPDYGGDRETPTEIAGQALHAFRLSFEHPVTGKVMDFTAPVPRDIEDLIEEIENVEK